MNKNKNRLPLTKLQEKTLTFITNFRAKNGEVPVGIRVMKHFRMKSLDSAYSRIKTLQNKGYL